MKLLKYQQTEYNLTDQEYDKILEVMLSKPRPFNIEFRGNILKTSQVEVFNNQQSYLTNLLEDFWSVKELLSFQDEIEKAGSFKKLLIKEDAWVVNDKYPEGAVRDHRLYEKLHSKRSALMTYRNKQEREAAKDIKEFKTPENLIKSIDEEIEPKSKVKSDEVKDKVNIEDIPF